MRKEGFSLLELSIVITILAILTISGTIVSLNKYTNMKIDTTNNKMNEIQRALEVFFAENGRLPCPAQSNADVYTSSFGTESITFNAGANATCNQAVLANSLLNKNRQYMGVVPTRTLGLPDNMMFDGWGNRMSYVTQVAFVNSATDSPVTNASCVSDSSNPQNSGTVQYLCYRGQASGSTTGDGGNFSIKDQNGNTITNDAVYILLSHGETGYGAYTNAAYGGTAVQNASPPIANTLELENLDMDSIYVQAPFIKTFPHLLRFDTRNLILFKCNKYGNNLCSSVHNINIG